MLSLKITLLSLLTFPLLAQVIGSDQINSNNVSAWKVEVLRDYQGVYHFGDSEGESDLVLVVTANEIYGQIRSGNWSADGESWIKEYENLERISIEGDKFLAAKTDGQFVVYSNGTEKLKGLKINQPWSGSAEKGQYEIGIKNISLNEYFEGEFISSSVRDLTEDELLKLTKSQLKIMRNEVFARYGFIFQPGGEMDAYFRKQEWYQAQHKNVDSYLTELERRNVTLIKKVENIAR